VLEDILSYGVLGEKGLLRSILKLAVAVSSCHFGGTKEAKKKML